MIVTKAMKLVLEALGCRPLLCHACAEPIEVGAEIAGSQNYFVHAECVGAPITLPIDPILKEKLMAEIKEIGGLAKVMSGGTGDWQSKITTPGSAFTVDEIMKAIEQAKGFGGLK